MNPEEQTDELYSFIQSIVQLEWLSTLLTVLVVLGVTAVIVRLASRFLRRVLSRDNSPLPSSSIFINITRVVLWSLGISVVLSSCFGIDVTAAVAALGIGGIAISLGFQDTLSNLIGGLQLSITGVVKPGDHIEVSGKSGVVQDVTWRHTTLLTALGESVIVPNSVINKTAIVQLRSPSVVSLPVLIAQQDGCLADTASAIEQAARDALASRCGEGAAFSVRLLLCEVVDLGFKGSLTLTLPDGVNPAQAKHDVVLAIAPYTHPTNSTTA